MVWEGMKNKIKEQTINIEINYLLGRRVSHVFNVPTQNHLSQLCIVEH